MAFPRQRTRTDYTQGNDKKVSSVVVLGLLKVRKELETWLPAGRHPAGSSNNVDNSNFIPLSSFHELKYLNSNVLNHSDVPPSWAYHPENLPTCSVDQISFNTVSQGFLSLESLYPPF